MVRIHPDPPGTRGAVAQLGEHLLCKQGVVGSIPISSTSFGYKNKPGFRPCAAVTRHDPIGKRLSWMSGFPLAFWPERIGCSLTIWKARRS
jgi:hypothetical protein